MKLINKFLNRETIFYLIFGVLTTIVNFVVFTPLNELGMNSIIANTIAWVAAVIFAYITNKIFVFNSTTKGITNISKEILMFFLARVFSLLVENVGLLIADIVNINTYVAKIFLAVFVVIINYVLSKLIIFNKEDSLMKTLSNKIKENNSLLVAMGIAFIVPIIILVGIFIGREVFPFGEQMYLRSDCYHQYAPFYKELYRKLTTGGSLTYSWEIGMGVNFTSLYAYYLASPVNLLLGLVPEAHIIEAMEFFIILKVALACTFCAYYLSKRYKTTSLAVAAFGLFYGFSSYYAAYSWNIMWLDCLALLPLIILGLERLVKNNKCILYCVALGISIFSNYYISIMICIYCVIYFIYLVYTDERKKTSYFVAKRSLNFIIYSVIAGGFGACLILPEIYTLGLSSSGDFNFPASLSNYFSI